MKNINDIVAQVASIKNEDFFDVELQPLPESMFEAIQRLRIATHPWGHTQEDGTRLHCVTFFAEETKPESLLEAFHKAITTYDPSIGAIHNDDHITFVRKDTKDIRDIMMSVDLYGDELSTFPAHQCNAELDQS